MFYEAVKNDLENSKETSFNNTISTTLSLITVLFEDLFEAVNIQAEKCGEKEDPKPSITSLNSLTPKSVSAGTKLVPFGRYVLNIYVGIVQYFLRKTKTRRAKIYLLTQRTNRQISYDIY